MSEQKRPLTYRDAGVDIDAGNDLVKRIGPIAKRTLRPEVMGGLGGFGALCALPEGYKNPVLVAGTDGVGTKLRLAMEHDSHDTVGIDLVAMCVNDLVVGGAEPLFFLDYYATGKLDVDTAARVVSGIGEGCEQAGCALIGGETAEMPGMYEGEDYDLAGFCVGVVERDGIIDGGKVEPGDTVIGLGASGPHSNGYSLVRRILEQADDTGDLEGKPLMEHLLAPTRIYVKSLLELIKQVPVHPIQYALVGLAISIFFLLLVSLSEHIPFGWAYSAAAVACIGLIGFYLSAVLRSRARGLGFAAMLAALYAALYGLLVLEDNALVVGAGLLFAILAAIMIATRKVDWYALGGGKMSLPFSRTPD